MRRLPLLLRCCIVGFLVFSSVVQGQRIKQGCLDSQPFSCSDLPPPPGSFGASVVDAEAVCTQLAVEIFPNQAIFLDVTQHEPYLNGIEPDSELCAQVRVAYSQCIFCYNPELDPGLPELCYLEAVWTRCGDQPTLEQVLAENWTDAYVPFTTEQDVYDTCAELEDSYGVITLKDSQVGMPTTQELCRRQNAVKHLCPGYCEGGCFDGPMGIPPSCDAYTGPRNEALKEYQTCYVLDYDYLFWLRPQGADIWNISRHADYLRGIPGNTTECRNAQQSYNQCFWCHEERCFDESSPPSCDPPGDDDTLIDLHEDEAQEICGALYSSIIDLSKGRDEDFFDVTTHADRFYIGRNTTFCPVARQSYRSCLWCHQTEYVHNFCTFGSWCDSPATLPENFELGHEWQLLNVSSTESAGNCSTIYDLWKQNRQEEGQRDYYYLDGCYRDIWLHRQCPEEFCDHSAQQINTDYLGADTEAQKAALLWTSRTSAFISFAGSIYMLKDILWTQKKRKTVYYQLLIGVAIFDLVTSISWSFATLPIDTDTGGHVYGARGNEKTCTAQAFFIQLGFSSIFYNVSLATYYVLTIARGWKEFQLRKIRWYLYVFPAILGLGLACGAITNYHWIEYGCHILSPPEEDLWVALVFVVAPLGLSIVFITTSMVIVYYTVRKQAQKAKKWRLGGRKKGGRSLEAEVFWQCFWYTVAFYVTWPIMFSVYLKSVDDKHGLFGLSMTVAFVAPLSGFTNTLVFVRPHVKERVAKMRSSLFSDGGSSWSKAGGKSSMWAKMRPGSGSSWFRFRQNDSSSSSNKDSALQGQSATEQTETNEFRDMDPSAILPLRESPPEQAREEENSVANVGNEDVTQDRLAEIPESQELNFDDKAKIHELSTEEEENAWYKDYSSRMRSLQNMAKP